MKLYETYKNKITFPILASFKLDGIFGKIEEGKMISKNGNEFTLFKHLASKYPDGTEGELYCHHIHFEDILSGVKRKKPNKYTPMIGFYPHKNIDKITINSQSMVHYYLGLAVGNGYEGLVLETEFGLLKYKPFYDEEFEITGFVEGKGKLKNKMGKFICGDFEAPPVGSHAYLEQLWKDRESLIGKQLTVQYQNKTKRGVPRFPKAIAVRDYE